MSTHCPTRHLDRLGRFLWLPNAIYAVQCQCTVNGEEIKLPKLPPSFWDFVTLPEEDRATTVGNVHKNW